MTLKSINPKKCLRPVEEVPCRVPLLNFCHALLHFYGERNGSLERFWSGKELHRGYYTVARRYEFYFRVAKQYFTKERSE